MFGFAELNRKSCASYIVFFFSWCRQRHQLQQVALTKRSMHIIFFFHFRKKILFTSVEVIYRVRYYIMFFVWVEKKYFVVFGCGLETDGFWRINPNNKVETNPLRFIMMKVTRKGIIYHKQKVNTRAIQCDHSDELEPRLAASTNSSMGKAGRFHGWPKPRASRQRHRFRASRGMTVRVWKIPNIRQTQTKGS